LAGSIEYEVPTWNQIYGMLFEQSEKISKSGYHPDILVGIARGGMIPARILADLLSVSQVAIFRIEFYTDIAKSGMQPAITQFLNVDIKGKKVLVIDDVSDSGQSLKIAKQYLIEKGAVDVKIATLYAKTATQVMPDFVEKITACWIVFPWEIKETLQSILQKQKSNKITNNEFTQLLKAILPKQLFEQTFKTLPRS
jgi:hypoxanthine phosphoribosyltransferase